MSDVNGMTTETAPVTDAPASVADTAPPSATGSPSVPASTGDVFAEPDAGQAVFDRGYVERLRREGARYRTEHQATAEALGTYNRVFEGYDPADRQVWLDLASTWATDPGRAAQVMQNIAQAVLQPGDEGGDTAPSGATSNPVSDSTADGLGELTAAQVQEMISAAMGEREQKQAIDREVENVYTTMRAAGVDPSDREGLLVLWMANRDGAGDVQAGIRELAAWKQSIVDDYVKGRANGAHPTPSQGGAVATAHEPIHDLRDARKAAQAYLDAQIGASSG